MSKTNYKNLSDSATKKLIYACKIGDIDSVKTIISSKTINTYSIITAYYACRGGNIELTKLITKMCIFTNNGNKINKMWLYCLEGACKGGHLDIFKLYQNKISSKYYNIPCFETHESLKNCSVSVAKFGEINLANYVINYITNNFNNVLQHTWDRIMFAACEGGHIDMINMIESILPERNKKFGSGVIYYACISGDIKILDLMVAKGANNWCDAFIGACEGGCVDLVKFTRYKNPCNFHEGFERACYNGHIEVVKYLMRESAKDLDVNDVYRGMRSACKGGHIEIVKFMALQGATNWNQGLMYACEKGSLEIVEFMISKGATNWSVACSTACHYGHTGIAKIIIAKGKGSIISRDGVFDGLYHACLYGYTEIVELILDCDVNNELNYNKYMNTACVGGHIEVVKLLIKKGTNNWPQCFKSACTGSKARLVQFILTHYTAEINDMVKTEVLVNILRLNGSVDVLYALVKHGVDITGNDIQGYLQTTNNFRTYRLCCSKYDKTLRYSSKYIDCLSLYPPYVLLVGCKAVTNDETTDCSLRRRLPTDIFRLLFGY